MMEELILIELNSNDYDKSNYFTLLFISKNSNPTNFTERIYIYIYMYLDTGRGLDPERELEWEWEETDLE